MSAFTSNKILGLVKKSRRYFKRLWFTIFKKKTKLKFIEGERRWVVRYIYWVDTKAHFGEVDSIDKVPPGRHPIIYEGYVRNVTISK